MAWNELDPSGIAKRLSGRIEFRRPDAAALKVTPLDFNGNLAADSDVTDAKSIRLLPTTFYYLIEN